MYNKYHFLGILKLMISLIYTRIFFPNARLIRLPFDIRNRKAIKFGKNFTSGFGCRIEAHLLKENSSNCIEIGENVQINDYVHIAAGESIIIGDDVLIASKVFISDINHGSYSGFHQDSPLSKPYSRELSTKPVIIENNVWIGEGVCIMPGTTIGQGSIIGALSVVTKNITPNSIAVGNPAKVIKKYNFTNSKWETLISNSNDNF